jgi:hypothetical protein
MIPLKALQHDPSAARFCDASCISITNPPAADHLISGRKANPMNSTETKRILDHEVVDHGVEGESYFQGCGVAYTDFDDVATGIGDTFNDALADALESLAQSGNYDSADLDRIESEDKVSAEKNSTVSASGLAEEAREDETTYAVRFAAYCGMAGIPEDFDNMADARKAVADILRRRRRQGYPVSILETGAEWEIEEPEDSAMVPDTCGVLSLETNTPEEADS